MELSQEEKMICELIDFELEKKEKELLSCGMNEKDVEEALENLSAEITNNSTEKVINSLTDGLLSTMYRIVFEHKISSEENQRGIERKWMDALVPFDAFLIMIIEYAEGYQARIEKLSDSQKKRAVFVMPC